MSNNRVLTKSGIRNISGKASPQLQTFLSVVVTRARGKKLSATAKDHGSTFGRQLQQPPPGKSRISVPVNSCAVVHQRACLSGATRPNPSLPAKATTERQKERKRKS
ncbi:unnamed protein product [Heterobilharzia americana]|nr:unnamed protein product [Heterobilharzia americana]